MRNEHSFTDLPNEAGFGALVTHWLTGSDSWEWLPPPPTEADHTIYRHSVASAN